MKKLLLLTSMAVTGLGTAVFAAQPVGNVGVADTTSASAVIRDAPQYSHARHMMHDLLADLSDEQKTTLKNELTQLRETTQSELETAIKNNDFDAFVSARERTRVAHDAIFASYGIQKPSRPDDRIEPTDEQKRAYQQEKFDNLVADYAQNGELSLHRYGHHGLRGHKKDKDHRCGKSPTLS